MRYGQPGNYTNDATIADGVDIGTSGVTLTNSESGRIVGGMRFLQGGSTLINELGGIVRVADGADPYALTAITGSAGSDTVVNNGLVSGLVELGNGNDLFVKGAASTSGDQVRLGAGDDTYQRTGNSGWVTIDGGSGFDRVELTMLNSGVLYASGTTGFEQLVLNGNGQFVNFSGYTSILLGTPMMFGLALIDSINPLVNLALAGNSIRLASSSLRSISGSAAAEHVELSGSSAVAGAIDLGRGDDQLTLSRFGTSAAPAFPHGGAQGGDGTDILSFMSYGGGAMTYNLDKVQEFERLQLNVGYIAPVAFDIANASGLQRIDIAQQSSLTLRSSASPESLTQGAFGGAIRVDSASIIGRYGFPDGPYDTSTELVQGDDRLSVHFTNEGKVVGKIAFYIGDDTYEGSTGSVGGTVYGNAGNDTLIGGRAAERFEGGHGLDRLFGNGGSDTLLGGAGSDVLVGGSGADLLDGGEGFDTADYSATFGAVIVDLAAGGLWNDAEGDVLTGIETVSGSGWADWLYGDDEPNRLGGGSGDDNLAGRGGDDVLVGGAGVDFLDGGAGIDTADYSATFGAVIVDLAAGGGLWNDAQGDILTEIEWVIGTGWGDWIYGNSHDNRLVGHGGADHLSARGGDDVLAGGANSDFLDGGEGFDTADYSGDIGSIFIDLAAARAYWNYAEGDVISGIEAVIGTAWEDYLYGNAGANRLSGGGGNDTLMGGAGGDILNGDAGVDAVDYSGTFGAVWANLQLGRGYWNDAEGDVLSGIENIIGSNWADILYGDAADNILKGNAGADILDGGAGADTADYAGNFGAVWVSLAAGRGYWNFAEGDTYSGIENVRGTSFNDLIEGDALGNVLTGGEGEDLFAFRRGGGRDTITDFEGNGAAAGDRIQLEAGLFSSFLDLLAKSTQVGSDVIIHLDAAAEITLLGVQLDSLHSNDFLL